MKTFTAQMDRLLDKTWDDFEVIFRMSVDETMSKATRKATSRTRGGTVKPGYIPRDTGALAASFVARMWGSTMLTTSEGADSYQMVVDKLKGGDVAQIGMTSPYAKAQHYGYRKKDGSRVRGWLWFELAARMWPVIVRRNAMKVRSL